MKIDFHVHTNASVDSSIEPKDLLKKSKKLGIIPAITDHNSIESHKKFKELKGKVILGEEVRTDVGDLIGLYIQELIPKKTPFLEALDNIKEQGGIACLPHGFDKFRYGVGYKFPEYAKKVEIIEVFNARCFTPGPNKKAEEFAKKHKKLITAGSDSHLLFEFARTYTELPDFDLENPKALLKALKKARIHGVLTPKHAKAMTVVYSRIRRLKRLFFGSKH